jgi:hypothetical protein
MGSQFSGQHIGIAARTIKIAIPFGQQTPERMLKIGYLLDFINKDIILFVLFTLTTDVLV